MDFIKIENCKKGKKATSSSESSQKKNIDQFFHSFIYCFYYCEFSSWFRTLYIIFVFLSLNPLVF